MSDAERTRFIQSLSESEREALERFAREGWVLVPHSPTTEMLKEAWAASWESKTEEVWSEMLQAGAIRAEEIHSAGQVYNYP